MYGRHAIFAVYEERCSGHKIIAQRRRRLPVSHQTGRRKEHKSGWGVTERLKGATILLAAVLLFAGYVLIVVPIDVVLGLFSTIVIVARERLPSE